MSISFYVFIYMLINVLEHSLTVQYMWVNFRSSSKNIACERTLKCICLDDCTLGEDNCVLITVWRTARIFCPVTI